MSVAVAGATMRRRWAYDLIHRRPQPPPSYESAEWLALEDDDPVKVAGVVVAAECWAQSGDTLELDLRRELEAARTAFKQAEDGDYAARAEAHRKEWVAPSGAGFAERRQAQLAAVGPRAGDYPGGPVPWIPVPRTETAIGSGGLRWDELFDAGEPEPMCDVCHISLVVDPGGCGDGCRAGNLSGGGVMSAKKSAATLLVEIAVELYTFGCVTEGRQRAGDPAPVLHTFASPKNNPNVKRPLADIRPDLAEMFSAMHAHVPNASALGDAMTVLEAKATKAAPVEGDAETVAGLLGGRKDGTATKLVQLAKKQFTFGVTTTGEAYAVPIDGPNVARVLRGGRRSLRAELARAYFEKAKTAANAQALADALLVLEGEAQGLDPTEVSLRVGRSPIDGRLVLDLGGEDGAAVVIGAYGWEIVDTSPVLFWRTNATLPLPVPDDLGSLDDLRELLNIAKSDWPLIVAWLVAALMPELPHPVLLLRGEHGTAKSSAARLVTSLLDRCASQLRTAPRNVEDWAVAAAGSWVTCLDNVSDLQHWLQDAICRGVTGDGLLRRQLYTDSDVSVLAFRRVLALTSVDPGALNGDLADRLLTVELDRISEASRASEEDLTARWDKAHPRALGGLLHVAVNVLRVLPAVRRSGLPRMADFARVLLAVDEATGSNGYTTYTEQASKTAETVVESDSVSIAITETITSGWEGTASELLRFLTADKPPKDWPSTPQGMGGRLTRAAPTLRALDWTVEKLPRTGKQRRWNIVPPEEYPAQSSPSSPTSPPGVETVTTSVDSDNGDDPTARTGHPERAGHDGSDDGDDPDGYSSECRTCSSPLLLTIPGRDTCERCRLHPEGTQ
ncbi:MAG: hypothetical protein M3Q87_09445 [Actinomycetota bacterium]|nr:hypothetical protein [Actinomycetota bacterium]